MLSRARTEGRIGQTSLTHGMSEMATRQFEQYASGKLRRARDRPAKARSIEFRAEKRAKQLVRIAVVKLVESHQD